MKKYVIPTLLLVTLSFVVYVFSCKNLVQSQDDRQLLADESNIMKFFPAVIDTPHSVLVAYGNVYVNGHAQDGVTVTLRRVSHEWTCVTKDGGRYEFWFAMLVDGVYSVQACHQGFCNRGPNCEDGVYQFNLSTLPVHRDLCIGNGGPCPYANCW